MRLRSLFPILLAALATGCASTGAVPRPFPTPGGAAGIRTPPGAASRSAVSSTIVGTALGLRGVPYRVGGADPSGFDCSGLVRYVFARHGLALPRLVREQYQVGRRVKPAAIKPGDLIFFSTTGRGASHVAIAIGDRQFVHAPTAAGVVRVETLESAYWGPRYVGARRITTNN